MSPKVIIYYHCEAKGSNKFCKGRQFNCLPLQIGYFLQEFFILFLRPFLSPPFFCLNQYIKCDGTFQMCNFNLNDSHQWQKESYPWHSWTWRSWCVRIRRCHWAVEPSPTTILSPPRPWWPWACRVLLWQVEHIHGINRWWRIVILRCRSPTYITTRHRVIKIHV